MRRLALGIALSLIFPVAARAQCPETDTCCHAGDAATVAPDWKVLHEVVTESPGCDDGWIGEAYSEKVSILLAERWSLLVQLAEVSNSDPSFLAFVLKHIDETVPQDRWAQVHELATHSCPEAHKALCQSIRARTG
jgi:hypothetical protein